MFLTVRHVIISVSENTLHPFNKHGLTPIRINNHMPSKVLDEIHYPFQNFKSYTVEVWEWIRNFITYLIMDVIIYLCSDLRYTVLVKGNLGEYVKSICSKAQAWTEVRFSTTMLSYQYRDSHFKDKTISRPCYLCNGDPIPEKRFILKRDLISLLICLYCSCSWLLLLVIFSPNDLGFTFRWIAVSQFL